MSPSEYGGVGHVPTGLMQGAAGVGLAMLHLDGVKENRSPFVVLPDNPFTA
jgi:hypothetical protein